MLKMINYPKAHTLALLILLGFTLVVISPAQKIHLAPALVPAEIPSNVVEHSIAGEQEIELFEITSPEIVFVSNIATFSAKQAQSNASPAETLDVVRGSILELPGGARARLGHGTLRDAVLFEDGLSLVAVGSTGVYFYRVNDFSEIWSLKTNQQVEGINVSADGKTGAIFMENRVQMLDTESGQQISEFETTGGQILRTEFDQRGSSLAVVAEHQLSIWDTATTEQTFEYNHGSGVSDIAWSPDGEWIALADNQILLMSPGSGQQSQTSIEIERSATQVVWSPDGSLIGAGLTNGGLALLDVESKGILSTQPGHDLWVNSMDFSPDSGIIASGGKDGKVVIWNSSTGEALRTLEAHEGAVLSVNFMPDNRHMLSAGLDGQVILWDVFSGNKIGSHGHFRRAINEMAWSPDGRWIATGGIGGKIFIWQATTGEALVTLDGHQESIERLVWSQDSTRLASLSSENAVLVWDVLQGSMVHRLEHSTSPSQEEVLMPDGSPVETEIEAQAYDAAFTPGGRYLALGGKDTRVYVWDLESGEIAQVLEGHMTDVLSVDYISGGEVLVSMSYDGAVYYWDTSSGSKLDEKSYPGMASMVVAPDEEHIALGEWNGHIMLWDTLNDIPSRSFNGSSEAIFRAKFSPDGKYLASGADGDLNTVILWDTATGEELERFSGHNLDVSGVAFSLDSKVLASSSWDGTVLLWDINQPKGSSNQLTPV